MAKFNAGPIIGQASGSVAGLVFSHNAGGPYIRNRAIPTNPNTAAQLLVRANLSTLSGAWKGLTDGERQAWRGWARQNPVRDTLGNSITINGLNAYNKINTRLLRDGTARVDTPPVVGKPDSFLTFVQAGDIGTGAFGSTFTPALTTGNKVELWAVAENSAGVEYVENLYKFIGTSAVDEPSPWDNKTDIEAVIGTLVVGQTLHVKGFQFDPVTGLLSTALRSKVVIIDTP